MSGLYDNYNATNAANKYVGNNSMYGVQLDKPINYNWNNGIAQLPVGGTVNMSDIATGNNGSISDYFDDFSMAGFSDGVQGLGGLYQMYQGNQMLGLYEDQVADARKNSQVMRSEVARKNKTRDAWSSAYKGA